MMMFRKSEIKTGDEIIFYGHGRMVVYDITKSEIFVEKDRYMKKVANLDSFRITKINGRYFAKAVLHNAYGG